MKILNTKMIRKIFLILFIIPFFQACDKSALDRQPNDQMTELEAFEDLLVADKFLNNVYAELYGSLYNRTSNYLLASTTDEGDAANFTTGAYHFNMGSLSPMTNPLPNYWDIYYSAIRKANIFLRNIDVVPGNAEQKERLKGEAQFLKAFFYQQIFKYYGQFIIVDQVLTVTDDLELPKNSIEECVTYITSLCDEAISKLPIAHDPSDLGRATKGAAMALKAECLLFFASPLHNPTTNKDRWKNAADAAMAILSNPEFEYKLHNNYQKLFLENNNEEIIFAYMAGSSTNAMEAANGPSGYGGWCGLSPTQEMVDAYEMKNGVAPFLENGSINPLSGYDAANPYENRDPRFYASILYNGANWQGRAVESFVNGKDGIAIGAHTRSQTGYFLKKFLDESLVLNGPQRRSATWNLFRLGMVMLDFAEARNEFSGPDNEVYAAVDAIRSRAGMPALPEGLTQQEMRKKIHQERLIEGAFEDYRFWDVRRWKEGVALFGKPIHGMRITKIGNTLNYERLQIKNRVFDDKRHLFPIPQSEVNKNKNPIQNPGWDLSN
ncbi:RagB/SusD family nutrient uptake outer membrane protein [Sphingobacterium sp. HJSM2_6]|uniref:RagB/SusD family nutrient uptake outer membrane protein n=1 Tax=Sphingobacterium sp. HJSM2_6 TaxID=3366264 RepID=UPI003BC3ECCD